MKVYVAGKWIEAPVINAVQARLVSMGHTITHDWTAVEGIGQRDIMTDEERNVYRAHCAQLDIAGVQNADAVLALMLDSTYPYRGTFTEIGCALGLGKWVIIVCPDNSYSCTTNCFFHHPTIIRVNTIEKALTLFDIRETNPQVWSSEF